MSKYLDSNGLLYLWEKVKKYVAEHAGGGTADSVDWSNIQNKPELALKSDLSSVYKFKGSVANYASLPAEENEAGDVWNVESTGMNYAWTGEAWDALGESFVIESITNAEIDAIVAGSERMGYLDEKGLEHLWRKVEERSLPAKYLTQQEYDALPEEEKKSGALYLTPQLPSRPPGGDVFSTGEQIIGRWLNGKPLYRSVHTLSFTSAADTDQRVSFSKLMIDEMVSIHGVFDIPGDRYVLPFPTCWANTTVMAANLMYDKQTKDILIRHTVSNWVGATARIVLEYTKTTEQGG